jgi:hypothetical protein
MKPEGSAFQQAFSRLVTLNKPKRVLRKAGSSANKFPCEKSSWNLFLEVFDLNLFSSISI